MVETHTLGGETRMLEMHLDLYCRDLPSVNNKLGPDELACTQTGLCKEFPWHNKDFETHDDLVSIRWNPLDSRDIWSASTFNFPGRYSTVIMI